MRRHSFGRPVFSAVLPLVLVMLAVCGLAGQAHANAQYYTGTSIADLNAPSGSAVTFNTDTGVLTLSGGATATGFASVPPQSETVNGVQVFRFRNVNIAGGVTVTVTGSRPLSIAAGGDMYVSSGFDVSGSVAGRAGGGTGGTGGTGGSGGAGGTSAGTGGTHNTGGSGGDGGGIFANGSDGAPGGSGSNGNNGAAGGNGGSGAAGNAGDFGFGSGAGGPAGGIGGGGGTGSTGGSGGGGATTNGNGGGGGAGGISDGAKGGDGGNGDDGGAGTVGSTGNTGGSGIAGADGVFDVPVDTLDLYAGTGGAGGGAGGGGTGGGQGGGGGGGKAGGGAGGGGRGALNALATGGTGDTGGDSGDGGAGGAGGDGGTGGDGGKGGNGGGAVILSAVGILDVSSAMTINISAGTRGLGVSGVAGSAGSTGSSGTNGATGVNGGTGNCVLFCGGDGGKGGNGGKGGSGGGGGTGGSGGTGGNGGVGTPGMIKLHGSIVRANNMQVFGSGGADNGQTIYQGKVTLISNMSSTAADANDPNAVGNAFQEGRTTDSALLALSPYTQNDLPRPSHPLVPQLTTGPAVEGILQEAANGDAVNYFNRTTVSGTAVEATLPPSGGANSIKLKRLTGSASLFNNFDQIFLVNDGATNFFNVAIKVGTNPAVKINGTGSISAGTTWTTTVPAGTAVSLIQTPIITAQPTDKIRFPDDSVVFTVSATSTTPTCGASPDLCYQWYTDRTGTAQPIGGETSDTLTMNNIQPGVNDGHYWCEVSNDGGTTVSSMALLSFHPAPTITRYPGCSNPLQPLCTNGLVAAIPGQNQQMSIEVSVDTVGETYQWQRCNSPADCTPFGAGWTNVSNNNVNPKILSFTAVTNAAEGQYRCVVTNPSGTATSLPATLNVLDGAYITSQPQDVIVPPGTANIHFTVTAAGQIPIFYFWEYCPDGGNCSPTGTDWVEIDGGAYPTANDATLDLGNADIPEAGYYRCKVNNAVSGVFDYSDRAILSIADPGIFSQPTDLTVDPGQTAGFTVIAVGSPTLAYQWFKDGVPLSAGATGTGASISFNGTGDQITISNAQNGDEGSYRVLVTNSAGSLLSNPATLTVNDPPVITQQPLGQTAQLGDSVALQVVATSPSAMTYQWRKNNFNIFDGAGISGAQSDRLTLTNVDDADEGTYSVIVTNDIGSVTSDDAVLLIGGELTVTDCSGGGPAYQLSSRTLSVTTTGGKGSRTYQWQRNGINVGAQIVGVGDPFTATLQLNNITAANAGTYRCVMNDDRSRDSGTPYISCDLALTVYDHLGTATITVNDEQVSSIALAEHQSATFRVTANGGLPPVTTTWYKDDGSKSFVPVYIGNTFQLSDLSFADAATYQARVHDAGTDQQTSNSITLTVDPGVPVAGGLGIAALAALAGLGGAKVLRRRK